MSRTQPIDPGVRGSAAILVIAAHVVVIYAVAVTLGVVPPPSIVPTTKAVFIQTTEPIPEPTPPVVEPVFPHKQIFVPAPEPVRLSLPEPDRGSAMQVTHSPDTTGLTTPSQAGSPPIIETTSIAVKRRIDPLYPPSARRLDQEGTVRVRILVDERGRASDVQVARSSGYDSLDDAAVSAVRRWQFIPATENSRAVSAWTEVSVVFRLDY